MSNSLPNLRKVLIPITDDDHSLRAVTFAANLLSPLSPNIAQTVFLLHVIAPSYIEKMASNVDIRFRNILESPIFKNIIQQHIENNVKPFLDKFARIFKENSFQGDIQTIVSQGEPGKEIVNVAQKNNVQSIIMGRRRRSHAAETFLGSASQIVIHRAKKQFVYIVGQCLLENGCPVNKILVALDGSSLSLKALDEAAAIASSFPPGLVKVSVVSVIDPLYLEKNSQEEKEAHLLLEQAKNFLLKSGLNENYIETFLEFGDPGRTIAKIADDENYPLVMMGRTGKTGLKEIVLGSVSTRVIHKVKKATVGLAPVEDL
ncbi:UspA domain-containing protein [Thermodesulfatator indicus DSM 15286]|uniref:UspA domain-containing protein n=1 Tax=Thermodesulfatator indicus (strain DSM 15286 / JCM 11887 / CIR29812) TaxID=667014 RepID=F8AA80_THEID|nr:universal stress protein [Thermodesulfatator indicus]AEH44216.1 UspA domain-containing protein [Thermodesulfatator indicus DSM 15286]